MTESKIQDTKQLKRHLFKSFFIAEKRQTKVYNQIKNNGEGDFDFFVLTLFAGFIISLGIIIDSAAVVIGGMLLAPMVWPILGMALGITMGRSGILQKSLITILKATLLIIIISLVVGLIAPDLTIENKEFLSRTSPTLLELLVGLASGFVGAFIITYPKIGSAISGVVVAAALVPPIATIGLSLARGDFDSAAGAFLLYLSNLIAITFAASILFLISNLKQHSETATEKMKSGFRWSLLLLIIMIIPLVLTTIQTASSVKKTTIIKDVVNSSLSNVSISDLKTDERNGITTISLTLQAKENVSEEQIKAVESVLNKRLKNTIILNTTIIPVVLPGEGFNNLFKTKITSDQPAPLAEELNLNIIKCPVSINNQKITRAYPEEHGCPICPKIIACSDGREFPGQKYNEDSGLCEDILFAGGTPCFNEETTIPEDSKIITE